MSDCAPIICDKPLNLSVVGPRSVIVPADPIIWNEKTSYEYLTLVASEDFGQGYVAKKDVPAGTELTDTEYWIPVASYNAQLAAIQSTLGMITPFDTEPTAGSQKGITSNAVYEAVSKFNEAVSKFNAIKVLSDYADGGVIQDSLTFENGDLLIVPEGTYTGTITITAAEVTVIGSGTINGKIALDVVDGDDGNPPYGNIVVMGIHVTNPNNACVDLVNVRGFNISNCYFHDSEYGVRYAQNTQATQRVNRGVIQGNHMYSVNYGVYLYSMNSNLFGSVADVTIANNQIEANVCNCYLNNVDGCKISNETYFMPGYADKVPTKTNNIYAFKTNWLTVTNCTLFESGEASILLAGSHRNTTIANNNIGFSGERSPHSAIEIYGNDTSGNNTYTNMHVTGNNIWLSSANGVAVMSPIIGCTIDSNVIYANINLMNQYYYGTEPITGTTPYGIVFEAQDSDYNFNFVLSNNSQNCENTIGDNICNMLNFCGSAELFKSWRSLPVLNLPTHPGSASGTLFYNSSDNTIRYTDGTNTYKLTGEQV